MNGAKVRTILAVHSAVAKSANAEVRVFVTNACTAIVAYLILTNLKFME